MKVDIIEFNDVEIRVGRDQDILLRSPGYAYASEDRILIGEEAARHSRLHPRHSHNRFWKNLNQDPLQHATSLARHNADLAFAQLQQIHEQAGKPEEVILAVPGIYSREQLGLLLGLVEASPFNAIGMVDSAVAACAWVAGPGSYTHVDLHLHQAVLTRLDVSEQVTRGTVQLVEGAGMMAILDSTAHLIADIFIQECRFDPQHHPETEQSLYDQIPACLNSLGTHAEVLLEIQYESTLHQAKISSNQLLEKLRPRYEKIAAAVGTGQTCLLSRLAGKLPGFRSYFPSVEVLSDMNVIHACQAHEKLIRSENKALTYVTTLPASPDPLFSAEQSRTPGLSTQTAAAVANGSGEGHGITHVLLGHRAFALNSEELFLAASGSIELKAGTDSHCSVRTDQGKFRLLPHGDLGVYLNGRRLDSETEINAGDIVSFVGSKTEFTFIHVSD